MKLLFREISKPSATPPGAGELYIHPSSPELQHRRDLAMLVVQQGLACLRQGAGPIETIVVRADPTLDDLLAAAFAGELLAGRPLPKAAEAFARYAALVREGLTHGAVSLEVSMQGIFKAIRTAAGNDLTSPEAGQQFAADWARMARPILQAAESGQDPFATSPFAEGSEFAASGHISPKTVPFTNRTYCAASNGSSIFQTVRRAGERCCCASRGACSLRIGAVAKPIQESASRMYSLR